MTLIDHVIIAANDDYRSMLDLGFLPERGSAQSTGERRPYGARIPPPPPGTP
jgi:hypothetical protein